MTTSRFAAVPARVDAAVSSWTRLGCVGAIAISALVSCKSAPTPEELDAQFVEAERLCLEGQFVDARTVLKSYLLNRPDDAGAHYYLGRAYLVPAERVFVLIAQGRPQNGSAEPPAELQTLAAEFRPAIVEGEFQTALRLFRRHGRVSSIERYSAEYFEMMCYLDSARVIFMHSFVGVISGNTPGSYREPIRRALGYVESARAVMPKAAEVDQIGEPIRQFAAEIGLD